MAVGFGVSLLPGIDVLGFLVMWGGAMVIMQMSWFKRAGVSFVVAFVLLVPGLQMVAQRSPPPLRSTPERPRIDPQLASTADEFDMRLTRNFGGSLDTFRLNNGIVYVNWTSAKCDQFDGELIDLVLSIKRTRTVFAIDVKGRRACEGSFRDFRLGADAIYDYIEGKINDSELLRLTQASQ